MTTTPLFKKVIAFSDIHFGLKHNSEEHNQDCLDFIDWLVEEAKKRDIDTCMFLGDWHHHRSNVNLVTLDYTMRALRKLNESFSKVYILVGNHDMYYREKRDIHSMIIASEFNNLNLISDLYIEGDVAFIPWLVNDEWKTISSIKSKYIFGHLELPGFKMNANIEMPDNGKLNPKHFLHQDYIFSGHFHMRQQKGKIHYIGNPFGHNYADAWDFERGAMILEWGKDPEYIDYEGPRFISLMLTSLIETPEKYLLPKSFVQVILDLEMSYEDASIIRESIMEQYDIRELKLIRKDTSEINTVTTEKVKFKTVDQSVIEKISKIDSDKYDINRLIEMYNQL